MKSILIAEGDDVWRNCSRSLFAHEGWTVTMYRDG
jgi:hypothetical protein